MNNFCLSQHIVVAANAAGRITFCPPTAAQKWLLKRLAYAPNETSAAHATDFAEVRPYKGATALAAVRSTASSGGSTLTQGTVEPVTLTAVGSDLEISQASPLTVRVDATPGAGVAVDLSVVAEFEELRV